MQEPILGSYLYVFIIYLKNLFSGNKYDKLAKFQLINNRRYYFIKGSNLIDIL